MNFHSWAMPTPLSRRALIGGALAASFGPSRGATPAGHSGVVPTFFARDFQSSHDDSDSEALQRAVDEAARHGRSRVLIAPREHLLHTTLFGRSGVSIAGLASGSAITFESADPASSGDGGAPRMGNFRSSAIVLAGVAPADDYTALPDATGDYFLTAPRPLAAGTRARAGSRRLVAADAAALADLSPGDWIHLSIAHIGWHPARSEMARVAAVDGRTIGLADPLRLDYSNVPGDLGHFADRWRSEFADAPGPVAMRRWPQCGFRAIVPIVDAEIASLAIRVVRHWPGFANAALLMCRARACASRKLYIASGGLWHLDSQDIAASAITLGPTRCGEAPTELLVGNGCNTVTIEDLDATDSSIICEEGLNRALIRGRAKQATQVVQVQRFCGDVDFDGFSIANTTNFGLVVEESRRIRYRGDIVAAGSAILCPTPRIARRFPDARPFELSGAADYYDGMSIFIDRTTLTSTCNPGAEIVTEQPIKLSAVQIRPGDCQKKAGSKPAFPFIR